MCASISAAQVGSSGPCCTVHASRAALVSGQAQQIFFFLGTSAGGGAGVDALAPILPGVSWRGSPVALLLELELFGQPAYSVRTTAMDEWRRRQQQRVVFLFFLIWRRPRRRVCEQAKEEQREKRDGRSGLLGARCDSGARLRIS